jgi:hypothetical protein
MRIYYPTEAAAGADAANDICARDFVHVSAYAIRRLSLLNTRHIPYLSSYYNIHT